MNDDTKKCPFSQLTTDFGAPVVDNQNSMTAGARGASTCSRFMVKREIS